MMPKFVETKKRKMTRMRKKGKRTSHHHLQGSAHLNICLSKSLCNNMTVNFIPSSTELNR